MYCLKQLLSVRVRERVVVVLATDNEYASSCSDEAVEVL